ESGRNATLSPHSSRRSVLTLPEVRSSTLIPLGPDPASHRPSGLQATSRGPLSVSGHAMMSCANGGSIATTVQSLPVSRAPAGGPSPAVFPGEGRRAACGLAHRSAAAEDEPPVAEVEDPDLVVPAARREPPAGRVDGEVRRLGAVEPQDQPRGGEIGPVPRP